MTLQINLGPVIAFVTFIAFAVSFAFGHTSLWGWVGFVVGMVGLSILVYHCD